MNKSELTTKLKVEIENMVENTLQPREENDLFSTEYFLYQAAQTVLNDCASDVTFRYLDRLCKKVDVQKKVRRFYELGLSKPVGCELVSSAFVKLLCVILLFYSLQNNDYKFLNTGMKMVDGILLEPNVEYEPYWSDFIDGALLQLQRGL